jgi:polyisoprenoid-binding protein YceI
MLRRRSYDRRIPGLLKSLRTRRGGLLTIGGVVVALGVLAFALVYFVLFPTSAPKPFALTATRVSAAGGSATQIGGNWKIGSGSEAGYRVREKLVFLPAQSDAVGRTSAITGRLTFAGKSGALTVTAASFSADVSKLKSDRSMRDQRIHTIGLQSDTYPTAKFSLSAPIKLPADAQPGRVVKVSATGALTIHGTSKTVTIPLEIRLSNASIETVGSLTFPWGEFGMTAPSVGGFVNVTGKATMEFDLHLLRG